MVDWLFIELSKTCSPVFRLVGSLSGSFVSCFILAVLSFTDETSVDNDGERIGCSDEECLPLAVFLVMLDFLILLVLILVKFRGTFPSLLYTQSKRPESFCTFVLSKEEETCGVEDCDGALSAVFCSIRCSGSGSSLTQRSIPKRVAMPRKIPARI